MVWPRCVTPVQWFAAGAWLAATALGGEPISGPAEGLAVAYRANLTLPDDIPASGNGRLKLVGLSGITWLGGDRYAAVMDNSANLITFRLELSADGTPLAATAFEAVLLAERHDYEDLVPRLGGGAGVFVCEEDTPAIRGFRLRDGAAEGTIPVPGVFRGRRPNRGLESLALDPDGRHVWAANEEALTADGPAAAPQGSTVVRIVRLPLAAREKALQFAYLVDPPHAVLTVLRGPTFSGVVALVALGHGRLLVLERSAGPGLPPFESRIYLVDTTRAVDVSAIEDGLAKSPDTFVGKTQLWTGSLGLNLEGLCLGPRLGPDRRALVAIADNGGLEVPTRVAGFEISAPGTGP